MKLLAPDCGKVRKRFICIGMAKGQEAVRVYMSPEKKRAFKAACAAKGLEMSEVANNLIDEWLTENAVSSVQRPQAG
jgi:ParG